MPATLVDQAGHGDSAVADRKVDSVCPYCGVGCQLTYHIKDDEILYVEGRDGPSNENRLCVKGRFGYDYPRHPSRLVTPLIRREGVAKRIDPDFDPAKPLTHFREASWDEALEAAAGGLVNLKAAHGLMPWRGSAAPSVPTKRRGCSRSWCVPALAPTMWITVPACATQAPWRHSWSVLAQAR